MFQPKRTLCGAVALLAIASSSMPAVAATIRPGDSTVSAARAAQAGLRQGAPMRGDSQLVALLPIWLLAAAAAAAVVATVAAISDSPSSP